MKLSIALWLCASAFGQVAMTLTGPATAKQGAQVTLSLSSSGATAVGPAGLQWTITPPAGFAIQSVGIGTQGTAAGKGISCDTSNTLCLLFGVNQNVIVNGQVATITVQVPAGATPGPSAFSLSNLLAADRVGTVMPSSAGVPYTLNVLSRSDIDGDGATTASDVTAMAGQVTSGTCSDDQNVDGKCDLIDVLLVVLRALGL